MTAAYWRVVLRAALALVAVIGEPKIRQDAASWMGMRRTLASGRRAKSCPPDAG